MKANRLRQLPPYLFEDLENRYNEAVGRGRPVIDLSIGDPDLAPPVDLAGRLAAAMHDPEVHRYPPQRGTRRLKAAIRDYLNRRCAVRPDDAQILVLVGSKEGIAHLPWAVCNPGDVAVVPDPGYPVYASSAQFAGCDVMPLRLEADEGFLPDLGRIREARRRPRLLFLNYPNNPTSATATEAVFDDALDLASRWDTLVANDAAYADVYFDGQSPPLLCARPGALERPMIELFSFSKSFSITGWRIGFAVGRADVIDALAHLKANVDSGVFGAIQDAVSVTLDSDGDSYMENMRAAYQARRDVAVESLQKLGFQCHPACATFYVWTRVPEGRNSMEFALTLLERADVLVTPGVGFGPGGEGYFRIALTQPIDKLEEALTRIARDGASS